VQTDDHVISSLRTNTLLHTAPGEGRVTGGGGNVGECDRPNPAGC